MPTIFFFSLTLLPPSSCSIESEMRKCVMKAMRNERTRENDETSELEKVKILCNLSWRCSLVISHKTDESFKKNIRLFGNATHKSSSDMRLHNNHIPPHFLTAKENVEIRNYASSRNANIR